MWCRWSGLILFFGLSMRGISAEENHVPVIPNEVVVSQTENSVEVDAFQARFQRMLVTLFGLIAFMILGALAIKQLMRARVGQANQGSAIQLLETRALSHKASLHLVEIEGDRVLVGETASHLSLLCLSSGSTTKGGNE